MNNLLTTRALPGTISASRLAAACLLCGLVGPTRAEDKINYTDQVAPLIEANCSKCHNSDRKKADLDLTSYPGALKGSGSGPIVVSGNLDGSKLWKALTHAEEPFMPPNRPKLPDKELDIFKQWIIGGLLETSGGKAIPAAKSGLDLAVSPEEQAKPEGPPPMPQDLPIDCVVHTSHMRAITGLAASPWAPLVAVAGQKQVLLFNPETFELLGILPFNEGEPVALKFSHNGKLLLAAGGRGAKSGRVVLWDVITGEHLMTVGQEYDTVLAADLRPDQSVVALGGPGRLVKLYSTKTGELLHKLKKHTDWVTALAFSPNGQILASADRNGGISLWDPDSAQELFTLAGHKSAVTALSWRTDSKILASSSENGTVKLWEVQEGKRIKSWTAHKSGVLSVCFARDGRLLTCGRDDAVNLWDANGNRKNHYEFSGDIPLRAVFSHNNSEIIATDFSGRCAVWSTAEAKRLGDLNPNPVPLAQQLSDARKRLTDLQAQAATTSKPDAATNAPAGNTNSVDTALTAASSEVSRLEHAQVLSSAYRLRESLAAKKREQEKLTQTIAANKETLQKSQKDLTAAKELQTKAEAQLKSAQSDLARNTPAAQRLESQIKADEAALLKLDGQLHPTNATSPTLARQTGAKAEP